jgi:hypothetical protein
MYEGDAVSVVRGERGAEALDGEVARLFREGGSERLLVVVSRRGGQPWPGGGRYVECDGVSGEDRLGSGWRLAREHLPVVAGLGVAAAARP